jgi:hypothetical protein
MTVPEGGLTRMSEKTILIATKNLKKTHFFAICEFFRAVFPARAAKRPVYLQLRGPFVFPCVGMCLEKLTSRVILCQNEKICGDEDYFLRHSGPTGLQRGLTGRFGCRRNSILKAIETDDTLLRLHFGFDALVAVRGVLNARLEELEKWTEPSKTTAFDA